MFIIKNAVFERTHHNANVEFTHLVYHGWHLELERQIKDHPSLKLKKMLRGAGS